MVFLATSTGSAPKRRAPERRICGRPPRVGWAVIALAATLAPTACLAATEADLLPNERAFAFSARGVDERTVEARFLIADGYYLYREKLRFALTPGQLGGVSLPVGQIKEDEFFGRVETYRNQLVVRLPLDAAAPGRSVTVDAESQGCADIGVCYP